MDWHDFKISVEVILIWVLIILGLLSAAGVI